MSLIAVAPEGVSFDYMKKHMIEVGKYVNDSTDGLYQTYSMVAISFIPAPAPVNVAVQSVYLKDLKKEKPVYRICITNMVLHLQTSGDFFCFLTCRQPLVRGMEVVCLYNLYYRHRT